MYPWRHFQVATRCDDIHGSGYECGGGNGLIGINVDIEFRADYFDPLVAAVHHERLGWVFRHRKISLAREGHAAFGSRKLAGVGECGTGIEPNVGAVGEGDLIRAAYGRT